MIYKSTLSLYWYIDIALNRGLVVLAMLFTIVKPATFFWKIEEIIKKELLGAETWQNFCGRLNMVNISKSCLPLF